MSTPIQVGNLLINDFDGALARSRSGRYCLCGRRSDLRYGPAIWGCGMVCRRCRKLWTESRGIRWPGPGWENSGKRRRKRGTASHE
jgi:hypothetical protein